MTKINIRPYPKSTHAAPLIMYDCKRRTVFTPVNGSPNCVLQRLKSTFPLRQKCSSLLPLGSQLDYENGLQRRETQNKFPIKSQRGMLLSHWNKMLSVTNDLTLSWKSANWIWRSASWTDWFLPHSDSNLTTVARITNQFKMITATLESFSFGFDHSFWK